MSSSLAAKYFAFDKGEGYWSYINNDAEDFSHVIFDVLTDPNDKIKRSDKKLKNLKGMVKAVVFHHVGGGQVEGEKDFSHPNTNKKKFVFYDGIKPNHPEKIAETAIRNEEDSTEEDSTTAENEEDSKPVDKPTPRFASAQPKSPPRKTNNRNTGGRSGGRSGGRNRQKRNKESDFQANRKKKRGY